MNANWTMVNVTGNRKRLRIALPVLDESAEVVYQRQHKRTKRIVVASKIDFESVVGRVDEGEVQRDGECEGKSFSRAADTAAVNEEGRSAVAGAGRKPSRQCFSSAPPLFVQEDTAGDLRALGYKEGEGAPGFCREPFMFPWGVGCELDVVLMVGSLAVDREQAGSESGSGSGLEPGDKAIWEMSWWDSAQQLGYLSYKKCDGKGAIVNSAAEKKGWSFRLRTAQRTLPKIRANFASYP